MTFRKPGRQSRASRFSLHDPYTALRHGFLSLDALVAFLTGELERALQPDPPAGEPGTP